MKYIVAILTLCLVGLLAACGGDGESTTTAVSPAQTPASPPATQPLSSPTTGADAEFRAQRETMVERGVIGWGIEDETVIEAMRTVPRHAFVPDQHQDDAYGNFPLPIGHGQTISQPYIVALMTQEAQVSPGDKVLEVGTGSGYQAAVLAEIVGQVYTIEIIGALAERAEATLARLGYDNVTVRYADGYFGYDEEAPFDAIVVTAAPDHIPQPLIQQLKIDAHMIIPVGPVGGVQTLWRVTRVDEEEVRTKNLGDVRFVPLTREER